MLRMIGLSVIHFNMFRASLDVTINWILSRPTGQPSYKLIACFLHTAVRKLTFKDSNQTCRISSRNKPSGYSGRFEFPSSTSHFPTAVTCSEVSITLAAIDMRKSKGSWTWTPTPMMMGLSYSFLEPHLEWIPLSQKNRFKMLQVISGKFMETKANRSGKTRKNYQLIRHSNLALAKFRGLFKGAFCRVCVGSGLSRICSSEGLQFSPSQSAWPKQWCWKGSPPGFSRRSKHEFWGTWCSVLLNIAPQKLQLEKKSQHVYYIHLHMVWHLPTIIPSGVTTLSFRQSSMTPKWQLQRPPHGKMLPLPDVLASLGSCDCSCDCLTLLDPLKATTMEQIILPQRKKISRNQEHFIVMRVKMVHNLLVFSREPLWTKGWTAERLSQSWNMKLHVQSFSQPFIAEYKLQTSPNDRFHVETIGWSFQRDINIGWITWGEET